MIQASVLRVASAFVRCGTHNGRRAILVWVITVVWICSLCASNSRVATARTKRAIAASQVDPNIPSVFETLSDYFPIGAAIWSGDITGDHSDLLKKHFNSITAENDMKPGPLQPTEGTFNFGPADALVGFARSNSMLVRGHTLVWHNQNPPWLFKDANGNDMQPTPENKALLLQRLENHIRAVVSHFQNDVYAWDVVNEVIDPSQSDGFRRSQWFLITGTDYIDKAFQIAHEVAPNTKLFINDYDTTNPTKRAFLFNLVKDLKSRGIPVDGVGHQMHSNIGYPSVSSIVDTINMFSSLGVDNQITELDMSVYTDSTSIYSVVPEDILVKQGYLYRDFFQAFRQLKGKITGVTFWGEADDHTWLSTFPITRLDMPLLFDQNLQAKHAYWGVVDPLNLPGADLTVTATSDSNAAVRGRPLTYTITVTNNGPDPAADLSFADQIPNGTLFQSLIPPAGWSCSTPAIGSTGQLSCATNSLNAGTPVQFILTVITSCATVGSADIVNSATVTSTTSDPNPIPGNNALIKLTATDPPPVISGLAVDKPVLFPPNNQMVDVALAYNTSDVCDGGIVPLITINTPNDPGGGTQNWEIVDAHHIRLRASLVGISSNGVISYSNRIYVVTVTATDSVGASSTGSVAVKVPRKTIVGRPLPRPRSPINRLSAHQSASKEVGEVTRKRRKPARMIQKGARIT